MERVEVVVGDITKFAVDAIVNAANEIMLGGGGVDGAIHRAAGPELLKACRAVPEIRPGVRCPTGECRITPGFRLPARQVIHTVGPIWRGGRSGEPRLLERCYSGALALAVAHGLRSIAFPAVGCGVYGYPSQEAAGVARGAIERFLARDRTLERVALVAFDARMESVLRAAFG